MTSAIIVAAGSSRRMGFDKLAADLLGKPVLLHSILAFENCPAIDEVVVVTSPERIEAVRRWERSEPLAKLSAVIEGGAERHLSVAAGIDAIDPNAEIIAVHDGARPLVTPATIDRCIKIASDSSAVALAHQITDTLKRVEANTATVTGSVDRENLWGMETPQLFSASLLREAYEKVLAAGESVTDEVSAVEKTGTAIQLVASIEPNPKITIPRDLVLAEAILAARKS